MFQPKTYADLMAAFRTGAPVTINHTDGYISRIEREDGSGRCFNVFLTGRGAGSEGKTEFFRTAD